MPGPRRACLLLALAGLVGIAGCRSSYTADARLMQLLASGEFGEARRLLHETAPTDPGDRDYLLASVKAGAVALADGVPAAAEQDFEEAYDLLRTQGLNADNTTESIFVREDEVRVWKGEPFEQAMAFVSIGCMDAERGDWGNARAAWGNALFHLKDFGAGERFTPAEVARRAAEHDGDGSDDYLDHAYTPAESDFALAYLLSGVASRALGRREEASEQFAKGVAAMPACAELARELESGEYNALLVVEFGMGPRKATVDSAGIIGEFQQRTRSDDASLRVGVGDVSRDLASVCDINEMARDHRWNNLEDVRRVKNAIGQGLVIGGLVVASTGSTDDDDGLARLGAGLGLIALGAMAGENAKADLRHNEVLPQRIYLVPATIASASERVTLEIVGRPGARLTLAGLVPPASGEIALRVVRLPLDRGAGAPAWATSGAVLYANDATGPLSEPTLPYILGGRCVRAPREELVEEYHRAGLPREVTYGALLELYRLEGITLFPMGEERGITGHVLEGGRSLFTPLPGSAGFARLFGVERGAYIPRSREVAELIQRLSRESSRESSEPHEESSP